MIAVPLCEGCPMQAEALTVIVITECLITPSALCSALSLPVQHLTLEQLFSL